MNRAYVAALFTALAAVVLTGCAEHRRFGSDPPIAYPTNHNLTPALQVGKYGGSFTAAFLGDPKTFNFWISDDADSQGIAGVLYDSLETRDSFTLKFVPRLATLPKISADGLTYTYTLRPNLKWSDGQPLTTDDIVFTLNVLFDPNIEFGGREGMLIDVPQKDGTIKEQPFQYTKIDERTIQFKLPVKWAPAEEIFSFAIMPEHALEPIYRAGKFNSSWGTDTPPSQLVSSGPFVMAEYVPSQRIVYKPNPYFWKHGADNQQLAYLDNFRYLLTPDMNGMVLSFRSGGCDAITVPVYQYPTIDRYSKRDNYTLVNRGPDWGFSYFCLNLNPNSTMSKKPKLLKLFRDVRFRQACSYAIDRDNICNNVFLGLAHPLYAPITPADVQYYDPNVRQYPFNLDKARQLLKEIGCTPGADGMLRYEGDPVSFDIVCNVENHNRKAMETIISDELKSIGIDAKYNAINFNDAIRRFDAPPYDWEACVMGFVGGPEPNDSSNIWRSSGQNHQWWPQQKTPGFPWEARIDRDFSLGAGELDPSKRKKFYDDFQETLGEQQAMIFICYQDDYTALRNHFGNIEPSAFYGLSGDVYWNMEDVFDTHATGMSR